MKAVRVDNCLTLIAHRPPLVVSHNIFFPGNLLVEYISTHSRGSWLCSLLVMSLCLTGVVGRCSSAIAICKLVFCRKKKVRTDFTLMKNSKWNSGKIPRRLTINPGGDVVVKWKCWWDDRVDVWEVGCIRDPLLSRPWVFKLCYLSGNLQLCTVLCI